MSILIPDLASGVDSPPPFFEGPSSLAKVLRALEIRNTSSDALAESLPFSSSDATAGTENELQAVVLGDKKDVDLPITIEESNYYKNILRRVKAGETPRRVVAELEKYLNHTKEKTWENSWVRFPLNFCSPFARQILEHDLLQDKANPSGPRREDVHKFLFSQNGEEILRIPVSYLLKLALADAVGNWGQSLNLGIFLRPWLKRVLISVMAKRLRIELASAVYHVISCGDRGQAIYLDDDHRADIWIFWGRYLSRWRSERLGASDFSTRSNCRIICPSPLQFH